MKAVSIGFRAKTARAIAVALAAGSSYPMYAGRWNISLCDPLIPQTAQPHHGAMELPWVDAQSTVEPLEKRIELIAIDTITSITHELREKGYRVKGVGVVGSPDRDLERIGNRHMRAHAAEGILFRRVLEAAATKHQLLWLGLSDRDFEESAAQRLRLQPQQIKVVLATIGRSAGKPWRADERAAATAAWLVL